MIRVIPRDLFNDANLLKCLGALSLAILDRKLEGFTLEHDGDPFDIQQDETDGSTFCANVELYAGAKPHAHCRPMNSRDPWPLRVLKDDDWLDVFNDDGSFTAEFRALGAPIKEPTP